MRANSRPIDRPKAPEAESSSTVNGEWKIPHYRGDIKTTESKMEIKDRRNSKGLWFLQAV